LRTKAEHATAKQENFLVMNQHLGVFIKCHEGAIRASVYKNKPVETSFDPAVLARAARSAKSDIAFRQAPESGNGLALVKHHLDAPEAQGEPPRSTSGIGKGQA
jgi:hypothetical protein